MCRKKKFLVLTNPSTYKLGFIPSFCFYKPGCLFISVHPMYLLSRYFIIYKPYQVLSQFSSSADPAHGSSKQTLKDFFDVPVDVYPVGRLDYDSEGLLILTNDKQLNHLLLQPSFAHTREYWVQVEGVISDDAVNRLSKGMQINVNGAAYRTKAAAVEKLTAEPLIPPRFPPIRVRRNIPVSWVKITLTEGKNHHVRKMTAKAGFPTLRLLRYRIEGVTLNGMLPGNIRECERDELYRLLFPKS